MSDKLQDDYAEKVASLERQLEDTRNEMVEEQEIFYASTNESKNLITELKTELDAARGEIAEMKRSGMSDSVETKQAVFNYRRHWEPFVFSRKVWMKRNKPAWRLII